MTLTYQRRVIKNKGKKLSKFFLEVENVNCKVDRRNFTDTHNFFILYEPLLWELIH